MDGLGATVGAFHSSAQTSISLLEQPHDVSNGHLALSSTHFVSPREFVFLHHVPDCIRSGHGETHTEAITWLTKPKAISHLSQ